MTKTYPRNPFTGVSIPALSRRNMLKGAGAVGAVSVFSSLGPSSLMSALGAQEAPLGMGLNVPLERAAYQDNGATPWYANLQLGTPGQNLKFALDTGSDFVWVTSTLCRENGNACEHSGGSEFDYNKSSSFRWIDRTKKDVSFGPWGTMTVETGVDIFGIQGKQAKAVFYLSENYSGSNFSELDWDGGIGFPSASQYTDPNTTFIMQELMRTGAIGEDFPFLSFDTDFVTRQGTCIIGGFNSSKYDPTNGIHLPWEIFDGLGGAAKYLWTNSLGKYSVGSNTLASDITFCLDSGSSQFKGDLALMKQSLSIINRASVKPDITLDMGYLTGSGAPGRVTITPEMYEVKLEAGHNAGQTLPQFETDLDIPEMVLIGSILMDSVYTIFEYQVDHPDPRVASLKPVGMWLFNKVGGPRVIGPGDGEPASAGMRRPVPGARG